MKNKIQLVLLLLIVCLSCSGCNGTITRDIRHAGFTVSSKFECHNFYPKDKEDIYYEKILYMTDTRLINTEGKIYELSLSQKYANGENCKEAETEIRVKAILNNSIIKGMDNKYYYLIGQNDVISYSEIPTTDNNYVMYDLLLKEDDIVKVLPANSGSNSSTYYVLKKDGNIYSYEITKENYNTPPIVSAISIAYDKSKYGSNIIDFNYAGENLSTYIKTEDKVYRMRVTNQEQCGKFADVKCIYDLREDPIFVTYQDSIIAYNGSLLITNYKQGFTVNS